MFGAKPSQYGHSGASPFLQQGLSSGRGAGGLGRTVLNILGGAEDDPSRYIGMDMLKRGKGQAKNPSGLGKTVVRTAIKSYLGGALGSLGDIGTASEVASAAGEVSEAASAAGEVSEAASAAGEVSEAASAADTASDATSVADKVAEGADPARDPMFALKNMVGGAAVGVKNVLGGPTPAEGVRGAVQDFITHPRGAVMDFITQQTGIPIGGQAIVGKLGEMMGVKPIYTEAIQDAMGNRDPQRKYGNVNQAMAPNEYLQPPPVPSNASRQINRQGGVRNLVAQRFGEGSPITKYIGSYQEPGAYTVPDTGRSENVIATVEPGETISFSGDPNAPDPMSLLGQDIHQPLLLGRRGGPNRLPERGKGMWIPGTDILFPPENKVSWPEKVFGYAGAIASKFTGKSPGERFRESEEWTTARDYMREIERSQLQAVLEGRNLNPVETLLHHQMRDRIGAASQRVHHAGETRTADAHGITDPTGQGRRPMWEETWDPMQNRFIRTPDKPHWFADAMETPDKTGDKVYRRGASEVAISQWNPATRRKQYRVWNEETGKLTWQDTPHESNWQKVEAGFGDPAVASLRGEDSVLLHDVKILNRILDESQYEKMGAGWTPPASIRVPFQALLGRISKGTLSPYATPEEKAYFYKAKERGSTLLVDFIKGDIGASGVPEPPSGASNSSENTR